METGFRRQIELCYPVDAHPFAGMAELADAADSKSAGT